MKIAIGNDHTAYEYKLEIKRFLEDKGHQVIDAGCHSPDKADYPVYGKAVAQMLQRGEAELGVLICGTGVGIGITANKFRGVRCCTCSEPYSAKLARQHNNANCVSFGARVVGIEMAKMIVDEWLDASFQGGRHQARVDMIAACETENQDK
jgi:ribose 5-phosphate isomerase B